MDEMIRYIFGSLRCSEKAIGVFAKVLKKQRSFNRSAAIIATATTLHLIAQDIDIRRMNNEIENLKTEIKELRNTEGD